MKYKCVIFDCDGTLLDTLGDIACAMNKALVLHGYPLIPQIQYRDMVGWGIYKLAELSLPQEARTDSNIKTLADCAAHFMEEENKSLTKPYPGIAEMLSKLSDIKLPHTKKLSLAVLSNKPDSVLRQVVKNFFPYIYFDAVYGMRPGMKPKPEPEMTWELLAEIDCLPQDAIFAGDSEVDIETARNAGCFPLGVSWGFRSREKLEEAGAARIIDKPGELLEFFGAVT
ncbi:MAG: HAD family hydrolase [Treponema sp.]|jgi:phosphoglycolate phosphatase|nr:HAD family hydrolase [Treponema sp.]